jgi:hypothetical protein
MAKRAFELARPSRTTLSSSGPASTSGRLAGCRCTLLRGRGQMVPDCAAYYRTGDSVMTSDVAAETAHSGAAEAPSREARCRCH